jgi:HPt (histidine-containing phosphotransfer) domain-containing protein
MDAEVDSSVLRQLQADVGGLETVRELIGSYLQEAPQLLADLRAAWTRRSVDAVRLAAHTMKSTSKVFGASRLAVLSAQIEEGARAGTIPKDPQALSEIEAEFGRVKLRLQQWNG